MPQTKSVVFDDLQPGRWYRLTARRSGKPVYRFVTGKSADRAEWNGPDFRARSITRASFSVAYRTCDPVSETDVVAELDRFAGAVL